MGLFDMENENLNQWAVLWPAEGGDEYGRPHVGQRREIKVRWEWGSTLDSSPLERSETESATIHVDRQIPLQSILWKGRLATMPSNPTGLVRVVSYNEIPDHRGESPKRFVDAVPHAGSVPSSE